MDNLLAFIIGEIFVWIPIIFLQYFLHNISISIILGLLISVGIIFLGEYMKMKISGEFEN